MYLLLILHSSDCYFGSFSSFPHLLSFLTIYRLSLVLCLDCFLFFNVCIHYSFSMCGSYLFYYFILFYFIFTLLQFNRRIIHYHSIIFLIQLFYRTEYTNYSPLLPLYTNYNTTRKIYTLHQQYQALIHTRKCSYGPPPSATTITDPEP